MKILVIGGTRFIGPPVVERLLGQGHALMLFHRGKTAWTRGGATGGDGGTAPSGTKTKPGAAGSCEERLGDRRALTDHARDLRRFQPDVVLDMICLGHDDARTATEVFRGFAGRYVLVSSQDVYRAYGRLIGTEPGPPDPVPLTEDAPLREERHPYRAQVSDPEDLRYHYDKIPAEEIVMNEAELPGTVLRLPMVYGPGDYQHRTYAHLKRMDDERGAILMETGSESWRWSNGYVENVADAIVLAVTRDEARGEIYNVADGEAPATADWIRAIGRVAGWGGRLVSVPREKLPEHLRLGVDVRQDLVVSTRKIRRDLGHEDAVPPDEALRRTVAWQRENPPAFDPKHFDYDLEDRLLGEFR